MTKATPTNNLFFSLTRDYLNQALSPKGSPETVQSYTDALSIFRRYVSDERGIALNAFTFDDCTFDFVLDYRNWLLQDMGRSEQTVNHRLAALKAYLHYAASRDISLQQIQLAVSQVPNLATVSRIREVVTDKEALQAFLNAPPSTRIGRRDTTLLSVLFDGALRVSELTALKVQDLNLEAASPHLLIHGKGNRERLVPISDPTKLLIKAYLEECREHWNSEMNFVFSTRIHETFQQMSRRNVERIVQKYGKIIRKDFPEIPENMHPHVLRRSRATLLYQDGTPIEVISAFLGHASIQTTIDHYAFRSFEQTKEAMGNGTIIKSAVEPEWPDDNEEFARMCGLR